MLGKSIVSLLIKAMPTHAAAIGMNGALLLLVIGIISYRKDRKGGARNEN